MSHPKSNLTSHTNIQHKCSDVLNSKSNFLTKPNSEVFRKSSSVTKMDMELNEVKIHGFCLGNKHTKNMTLNNNDRDLQKIQEKVQNNTRKGYGSPLNTFSNNDSICASRVSVKSNISKGCVNRGKQNSISQQQ